VHDHDHDHDHDHPEFELICFFCGQDATHDHVMLGAFWDRDHGVDQEHWPAHSSCVLERMSEATRSRGGRFIEAMASVQRDG
jgi:hypothetical protein